MRNGDVGANVRTLQQDLNTAGAKPSLIADGWFGDKTEAAVIAFQQKHGITAIGVAGPRTLAALAGVTNPKHLGKKDLQQAAEKLGVKLAVIAAIAQVESSGSGFFSNGKAAILYERHIFYRQVASEDRAKADQLARQYPNLCNTGMGGYTGGIGEYQRRGKAEQLHKEAALKACSYGLFQIMGFHAETLGYESVQHFVEAMNQSEGAQLDALVRFIQANPSLKNALGEGDWRAFARGYNGPSFHVNMYDVKLERAYEHFAQAYKEPAAPQAPEKAKRTRKDGAKK